MMKLKLRRAQMEFIKLYAEVSSLRKDFDHMPETINAMDKKALGNYVVDMEVDNETIKNVIFQTHEENYRPIDEMNTIVQNSINAQIRMLFKISKLENEFTLSVVKLVPDLLTNFASAWTEFVDEQKSLDDKS